MRTEAEIREAVRQLEDRRQSLSDKMDKHPNLRQYREYHQMLNDYDTEIAAYRWVLNESET
jgi:cell fate (sporulation/competence/biofilm development) regulator YmcA (YheA/YmcA/DUF963 family)